MNKAIVTGAAGDIGREICVLLQERDYHVIGIDRHPMPHVAESIEMDLMILSSDEAARASALRQLQDKTGAQLPLLVNNAALQIIKPIADVSVSDWQQTWETNVLAGFWLIQCLEQPLRRARGSVVNIASIHAQLTKKFFSLYATSKAALVGMTKALALELAPEVRINAVLPAATDTQMLRAGFSGEAEKMASLAKHHPLQRIAAPREVAQAVCFLASEEAAFITGTALVIDGGIGCCLHDPFVM